MESRQGQRVIVLVDMDCFYVQVEQKLSPQYQNRPCAVVQYNTWKGGGIIAVNYEARAQGVSRRGRGEDAQKICPDIHLFRVPEVRGKADLTKYREAGASVMDVLCKFSECVERASIDEAYIDLTSVINSRLQNSSPVTDNQILNTFVVGYENGDGQKGALQDWLQLIYEEDHLYNDRMLAEAAVIVEEMRAAVYSETGYRCSAGIAHNKMLAKLSCGLHKPNKQTVLPESSIPILYNTIPVNKVRNLGGKFGVQVTEKFDAKTMGDLMKLSKSQFVNAFGEKSGNWLYGLSRGIENEPVTARQLPKSIGCGKNFAGKSSLKTKEMVSHWVKQLSSELEERLLKDQENNCRVARLLTITVRNRVNAVFSVVSRSCPIILYNADKIAHDAYAAIQKFNTSTSSSADWTPPIWSLAMSAGKFEDKIGSSMCDIQTYFTKSPNKKKGNSPSKSESNIDTVLRLLDSEPRLSDHTASPSSNTAPDAKSSPISSNIQIENSTLNNETLSIESQFPIGNSNAASRDISLYFNTKPSTSSEPDHPGVLNNNPDNDSALQTSKIENSLQTKYQKELFLSDPNQRDNTTNLTLTQKEEIAQKPMGFFAKKLAEKSKCASEKEVIRRSSTQTSNANNCDGVQSISEVGLSSPDVPSASHQNDVQTLDTKELLTMDPQEFHSELDPELTNLCMKCNQRIPIWEEEEHSDYHLALDLSKERTRLPGVTHGSGQSTVAKSSKTTRKRGNNSKFAAGAKRTAQQNTIDSFFSR